MKKTILFFILTAVLLTSDYALAQNWDLFAPAGSGLRSDSIFDIKSNGLDLKSNGAAQSTYLTYVLHPHAISRFNGLWEYFPDTFGAEAKGGRNNVFYLDPSVGLWIGRTNGLYFVPIESLESPHPQARDLTKTCFPDAEISPPIVTAIYQDHRNQTLWIGTLNRGLIRGCPQADCRSGRSKANRTVATQRFGNKLQVTDIVADSSSLWIGTLDGIIRMTPCGDSLDAFLGVQEVRRLHIDTKKRIWAATASGLFVASDPVMPQFCQVWTSKSCDDSTRITPPMTGVTQDFSGAIWAVSVGQIYRYRQVDDPNPCHWKPEVFPCRDEWPARLVGFNGISVDRTGFVWVASFTEGILRYNMLWETIKLTNLNLSVRSDKVNILYLSPIDGHLYVGTDGGAARRNNKGRWERLPAPTSNCIGFKSFFHDSAGFVLAGVNGCGNADLVAYQDTNSTAIRCGGTNCPTGNTYFAIVKLPNDTLWLAGDTNLWKTRIANLSGTKVFKSLAKELGLIAPQNFHTLLLQDKQYVWIGTDKSGLVRYEIATGKPAIMPKVGKSGSSSVRSLLLDSTGKLWIGTAQGLTRLDPPYNFSSPQWHDVSDTGEVDFIFPAKNGDLWFGAPDGVARYNSEAGVTFFPRPTKRNEGGPASKKVRTGLNLMENGQESFWFGTDDGISIFYGDLIPPDTRLITPSISDTRLDTALIKFLAPSHIRLSSTSLLVQYDGGDNFTPNQNLDFQTAFVKARQDETIDWKTLSWSNFTRERARFLPFSESGDYYFFVRTRDQSGNLDPEPASLMITADVDAPSVVITSPALQPTGAKPWVPDSLVIRGSVLDADLASFIVEVVNLRNKQRMSAPSRADTLRDKVLASFQIRTFAVSEDSIRIRVTAIDRLKHIRRDSVEARVDTILPEFEILEPRDSTQVSGNVPVRYRIKEKNPKQLRYADESISTVLKGELPIAMDDTLFTPIPIDTTLGKHTFKFSLSDQAGNVVRDSLDIFRVKSAISSVSQIQTSQDSLVEVHLPPGPNSVTILISPLDTSYSHSAKAEKLDPRSRVYHIEPDTIKFGREAALAFVIREVPSDPKRLGIFRKEGKLWRAMGGRFSTETGRPLLRTGIKQGGIYLAAIGATETFQPGHLTCLPRLFSPGRYQPSPFTEVVFTLDKESPVSIHIYNTAGRRVRSLSRDGEVMPPGRQPVQWDGRDEDGKILRSGIYIVVVKANTFTETKTVVIQN